MSALKTLFTTHDAVEKCIKTTPSISNIKTDFNLGKINEDEFIAAVLLEMNSKIINLEGEEKQRDLAW
ncbi:hypothetical protein ACOY7N_04910 [Enterobacter asburiae]|uniref:hypothetical protein n=1 Tax=Enterobacter asburiae TaxID=61645 RepID=UPI003BD16351